MMLNKIGARMNKNQLITLIVLAIFVIFFLSESTSSVQFEYSFAFMSETVQSPVTILKDDNDFEKVTPFKCKKTISLFKGITPQICIKNLTDFISGTIENSGAWEPEIVNNVLKMLEIYTDATLLDVGANLGMFTIAAAAFNRSVVSVDAVYKNHALIRQSLVLNGKESNVKQVYNGVSNEYITLYPYLEWENNEGGTHLVTKDEIKDRKYLVAPPVKTIRLEDVVRLVEGPTAILKIDIEGFECRSMENIHKMVENTNVFIPYIVMEWYHLRNGFKGCVDDFLVLVRHLYEGGYYPCNPGTLKPMDKPFDGAMDIIWTHRNAVDMSLGYVLG